MLSKLKSKTFANVNQVILMIFQNFSRESRLPSKIYRQMYGILAERLLDKQTWWIQSFLPRILTLRFTNTFISDSFAYTSRWRKVCKIKLRAEKYNPKSALIPSVFRNTVFIHDEKMRLTLYHCILHVLFLPCIFLHYYFIIVYFISSLKLELEFEFELELNSSNSNSSSNPNSMVRYSQVHAGFERLKWSAMYFTQIFVCVLCCVQHKTKRTKGVIRGLLTNHSFVQLGWME